MSESGCAIHPIVQARMIDNNTSGSFPFLAGGSETGELIRAFDWKKTPLGELGQWPDCLRVVTSLILRSDVPMTIQWGAEGTLLYNDAYCEIAGARHPGLLGRSVRDSWSEVAGFRAKALNHVLDGNTFNCHDQHMVLLRNGQPEDIWLDINYSPVVDEAGTPRGALAVVKNTTERFRADQRLRFAQEAGGVGTFEWFPDSGRLEVSDQYRRIWGLGADVVVTEDLLAGLVHPDDRDAAAGPQRNTIAYSEFRRVDPVSGEIRWIAHRGEAISPGSGVPRYFGVVMDITERKRSEQALAASEARERHQFEQLDIKEIRHRNVRILLENLGRDGSRNGKRFGSLTVLAELLGKSPAQVSRFAAEKPSTHIGDRIAREIEEAFEKERGWMDHVQWSTHMGGGEHGQTSELRYGGRSNR
jgi:PAS domain S-box-containing protein